MLYLDIIKTNFIKGFSYKMNYFLTIVFMSIPITINFFIWKSVDITRLPFDSMNDILFYYTLCYFVTAFIFNNSASNINYDFKRGNIILKKILPINYSDYHLSCSIGNSLFMLLFVSTPMILTTLLITYSKLGVFRLDLMSFFLFVMSLALSFLMNFLLHYLIGIMSFKYKENYGFQKINRVLLLVFSGTLIPLEIAPAWFNRLCDFLPYKHMVYTVTRMLNTNENDKLFLLLLQLIIVLVLWIAKRSLERVFSVNLEVQGG